MIRHAVLLGCLLAGATSAPAQNVRTDPRTRARELLTHAERANNRGRLRVAADQLRRLIGEGDVTSVGRAQSLLSAVYLESGRFDEALRAADTARRLLNQPRLSDSRALREYRQDAATRGADVQLALAGIEEKQNNAAAPEHLRRVVALLDQALGIPGGHRDVDPAWELTLLERLARLHHSVNQPVRSRARWEQLATLARRLRDDNQPRKTGAEVIEPVDVYVAAVRALGRYHAARGDLTGAIDTLAQLAGEPVEDELKVVLLSDIAALWHEKPDRRQEIDWLQQATELEMSRQEVNDRRLANLNGRRAAALDAVEEESAADEFWRDTAFHFQCAIEIAPLEDTKDRARAIAESMLDRQQLQEVYQRLEEYDDALVVATELLDLRRERYLPDDPRIFRTQTRIGTYLARLAESDKAIQDAALLPLSEAAEYWNTRQPAEPDVHARTLNVMAGIHRRRGALAETARLLNLAHQKYPADRLSAPVRMSLAVSRGLMLSEQGKYQQAIAAYQDAERTGQGLGRAVNELRASALLNLAMVYKSQLQFEPARRHCLQALDERLRVLSADDERLLPHYLALGGLELATALAGTRGIDDAIAELSASVNQCESICRIAGLFDAPTVEVGLLYHQRAMIHYLENRRQPSAETRRQARNAWQQALDVHQRTGQTAERARSLYYLSKLSQHDWQDAAQRWRQERRAEEEYRARQQRFDAAMIRFGIDRQQYIRRVGKYERELASYKRAVGRGEATEEAHKKLADERNSLADAKQQLVDEHDALRESKSDLDRQFASLGDPADRRRQVIRPLLTARAEATEAVDLLTGIGAFPNLHYLALCSQADILLHLSDAMRDAAPAEAAEYENGAVTALEQAVALTETPRSMVTGGDVARAEFFSNYVTAFDLLVRLHAERGRHADALFYAEKGRNRTFLDQLRAAEVDIRATIPPEQRPLLDREEALLSLHGETVAQARDVAQRLALASDDHQTAQLKAQQRSIADDLKQLRERYAKLQGTIYDASPQYARLLRTTTSKDELTTALAGLATDRGPLLYYYVGRDRSHLFLVRAAAAEIEYFPLKALRAPEAETVALSDRVPAKLLKSEVQRYRRLVSDAGRADAMLRGGLQTPDVTIVTGRPRMTYLALTEMILPDAVRQRVTELSPDYVTVVPDGALHHLPLEALPTQSGPDARFVLDDFPAIAYAPSITILKALVELDRAARPMPAALTLGNPAFSRDPAASVADNDRATSDSVQVRFADGGMKLTPLPGAEREARQVRDTFEAVFGPANVAYLIREKATEKRLRRELADRSPLFIHLATHGLVDDSAYNLFGAIALAASPTGLADPRDDGFLALHEVHALPLGGCELVVLSACQTNVGPVRPLESGATLARAFLSAGARRVVSSQWSVNDDSTVGLIGAYSASVAANFDRPGGLANYATALQLARLRIRNDDRWASPYFWAPFILVGPAD